MTAKKHRDRQIDINHLAVLANLEIPLKQKKKLKGQLEKTVDYINILNQLKTEGVKPTSQVNNLLNISRKDETAKTFSQKEALANAKRKKKRYFVTKRVKWE